MSVRATITLQLHGVTKYGGPPSPVYEEGFGRKLRGVASEILVSQKGITPMEVGEAIGN